MNEIIKHPQFGSVRMEIVKGEPLFCAADVCQALGMDYKQAPESALRSLDDDEKLVRAISVPVSGGNSAGESRSGKSYGASSGGYKREMLFVTESGLYALIMRSRKPEAKAFRKWVTGEVLPSIRKHGYYVHPQLADRKEQKRVDSAVAELLGKYLNGDDETKIRRKFRITYWQLMDIIKGREKNNAVMTECQRRAMINKNNEINAYDPARMYEVMSKLMK
jgi:prophage antirepressor-like protein